VGTRVAVVWQRKIASIAARIAKQSRRVPKLPVNADTRSVLEKLIETTTYRVTLPEGYGRRPLHRPLSPDRRLGRAGESRSHLPYPLRAFFERRLKLLENLIQLR
jgi:hypothetical protein